MCGSDDGQDDLMSRSTGMCESDEVRIVRSGGRCKNARQEMGVVVPVVRCSRTDSCGDRSKMPI